MAIYYRYEFMPDDAIRYRYSYAINHLLSEQEQELKLIITSKEKLSEIGPRSNKKSKRSKSF